MSLDQLQKDFKTGKLYPVYLLHGEESYLIDQGEAFLEEHLLQEHEKAFDQQILYGMDADARYVVEQLLLFPLIAQRRVVFVREAQQLENLKDLDAYVSKPVPSSILVLCHKGKSLDKRIKLYDAVKKQGFILSADRLKEKDVVPWLMQTAKAMHIQLTPEAAQAMVELIGEEISLLHPELQKLTISHSDKKPVVPADIIDLIGLSREYNVLELQKAIEAGNVQKIMRIGTRMSEQKGYSVIPLIALLNGHYSRLLIAKSLGNVSDAVLGEAIGNKAPFVIQKTKQEARKFTLQQLEQCIQWLHVYDMKAKGWDYNEANEKGLTIELLDRLLFQQAN
jgi:DNA polymerase-3 subunit delta